MPRFQEDTVTSMQRTTPFSSATRSNELLKLSSFYSQTYLYTCGHLFQASPSAGAEKTERAWQSPMPSHRHDGLAPQLYCGLRKAGPRPPRSTPPFCRNNQPSQLGKSMDFSPHRYLNNYLNVFYNKRSCGTKGQG